MVNQFLEGKAGVVSEVSDNVVVDVQARFPRLLGPRASGVDLSSIMGSSNGTILGKLLVKFPASSLLFKMDTNRLVGASAMHSLTPYCTAGGAWRCAARAPPPPRGGAHPPRAAIVEGYYRPDKGFSGSTTVLHDTPNHLAGATVDSQGMCWLQYLRKVSPNVGLAAQLRVHAVTRECMVRRPRAAPGPAPPGPAAHRAPATSPAQAVLGYTFAFPKAGSRMGAYVTNEGNIMAALEERFSDKGRIVFGADCSPLTHEYRFGLGIQYGPAADTVQFGRAEGAQASDGGLHHWLRAPDRSLSHAKAAGRTFPIGWGDALPSPRPRMPFSPVMQQMGYRFY